MNAPRRRSRRPTPRAVARRAHQEGPTLPPEPTPLIGRDFELKAVCELLTDSVRLVTLTGPPGIGKTRLAVASARLLKDHFRHGVRLVDLAGLRDPAEIHAVLAGTLRISKTGSRPLEAQLKAFLRERHVLFILDSFEQVLPAAESIVAILASCPNVRILATSREPLHVRWEHRFPVPALALPDRQCSDPVVVAQSEAAALFIERAQAVEPGFRLTAGNAQAVAEICVRLDGLPLAIVIAAAQSAAFSPADILAQWPVRELLSVREARDVPPRHRSLRDAIAWSYDVLTPDEQLMFRRLGVFAGSWALENTEAVGWRHEPIEKAIRILASLADKSLVQAEGGNGSRRFRMLEVIREYALEQLSANEEAEETRRAHVTYYLDLAERAEPHLQGRHQQRWFARLEQEHENLRAALRWASNRGEGEMSLRLTAALAYFWVCEGYHAEGRRWLEEALAVDGQALPRVRAKALGGAGAIALWQGDHSRARVLLQESASLAEAHGDHAMLGFALTLLSRVLDRQGDVEGARVLLERSFGLYRNVKNDWGCGYVLKTLGWMSLLHGDIRKAEDALGQALALFRRVGDQQELAIAATMLAEVELQHRDHAGAAALVLEALRVARLDRWIVGYTIMVAAFTLFQLGHLGYSVQLLGAMAARTDTRAMLASPEHRRRLTEIESSSREQWGEGTYHKTHMEGRMMSSGEVLDVAVKAFTPTVQSATKPTGVVGSPQRLLSKREQAVLRLVAEGQLNKQIARTLGISIRTVKMHISSTMNKLGAENRAHAAALALRRGDI